MRTIVHVSDLHFGKILEPTLEPLLETMWAVRPDVVIVSGDLTQRATPEEFRRAKAYIERMPLPQIVLPGNHDIPLYDIARRFFHPLHRYVEYVTPDLFPVYADDEVAIVGINSARSFVFKGGRLSSKHVAHAAEYFARSRADATKIVVAHHPFDIPEGLSGVNVVRGIRHAIAVFADCGVDLLLAGHLHLVHVASTAKYQPDYHATILQAGTATSTRARGEPNSFFIIRTDGARIAVQTHSWDAATKRFVVSETRILQRAS